MSSYPKRSLPNPGCAGLRAGWGKGGGRTTAVQPPWQRPPSAQVPHVPFAAPRLSSDTSYLAEPYLDQREDGRFSPPT